MQSRRWKCMGVSRSSARAVRVRVRARALLASCNIMPTSVHYRDRKGVEEKGDAAPARPARPVEPKADR